MTKETTNEQDKPVSLKELKKKSSVAAGWSTISQVMKMVMGLGLTVILTRLLNPEDYGLLALATIVISFSSIFIDFGFKKALIQATEVSEDDFSTIFWLNLGIGASCTGLIFLLAPWIAAFYDNPALTGIIRVVSINCVLMAMMLVQVAQLSRAIDFKSQTIIMLSAQLISGVVAIALALSNYGVWSLVGQVVLAQLLQVAGFYYVKRWTPSFVFKVNSLSKYAKFGSNLFGLGVISTIIAQLDYIIIGRLAPIAQLGFYQKGRNLNKLPSSLSSQVILSALFPMLSILKNRKEEFRDVFKDVDKLVAYTTIPLFGFLYLISEPLIIFMFTARWVEAATFFQYLCLAGFAYPLSALRVNTVTALGKPNWLFWEGMVVGPIGIVLLITLGYFFGIFGIIAGVIINRYLDFMILSHFCHRLEVMDFWRQLRTIGGAAGFTVAVGYATFVLSSAVEVTSALAQIVLTGLVFATLYFSASYFIFPELITKLRVVLLKKS